MHGQYSIPVGDLLHQTGIPVFEQGQPVTDADLNTVAHDWRLQWLLQNHFRKCAGKLAAFDETEFVYSHDAAAKTLNLSDGRAWLDGSILSTSDQTRPAPATPVDDPVIEVLDVVRPSHRDWHRGVAGAFSGRKDTRWNIWNIAESPLSDDSYKHSDKLKIRVSPADKSSQHHFNEGATTSYFRVEVHRTGVIDAPSDGSGTPADDSDDIQRPVLKWSHCWEPLTAPLVVAESEATVFPGATFDLSRIPSGSYVEQLSHGDSQFGNAKAELAQVSSNDGRALQLKGNRYTSLFSGAPDPEQLMFRSTAEHHHTPWFRLWNAPQQPDSQLTASPRHLRLTDTVAVAFEQGKTYRRGDYWLFTVTHFPDDTIEVASTKGRLTPTSKDGEYETECMRGWKVSKCTLCDPSVTSGVEPSSNPPRSASEAYASVEDATRHDLLSEAGVTALRQYLDTPREVLRRIPARYLKTAVTYGPLAGWLAPALISEIVDLSFDEFAEEFQQVHAVPEDDWSVFESEANDVLDKARQFSQLLASNTGIQSLLS